MLKHVRIIISFVFINFLSGQACASEYLKLARGRHWQQIIDGLAQLDLEDRQLVMSIQDIDGIAPLDIVTNAANVDTESFRQIMALLNAGIDELPEATEIRDPDVDNHKDLDLRIEDKPPIKPRRTAKQLRFNEPTDEHRCLERTSSDFGSAISTLISIQNEKEENCSALSAKHSSNSTTTSTTPQSLTKEVFLSRQEALYGVKGKIEHLIDQDCDPEIKKSAAMDRALSLIRDHKKTDEETAYRISDTSGNEALLYISKSAAIVIMDHNAVKRRRSSSSSATHSDAATMASNYPVNAKLSTNSTATLSSPNPSSASPLTREQALQFVKQKIEGLIDKADLDARKSKLESKSNGTDAAQRAIRALSGMRDASRETVYIYRHPENLNWEVVVYYDEILNEYNVYVVYQDRLIGSGSDGSVYFAQRLAPSSKDGNVRIVKKIINNETSRKRVETEIGILNHHLLCTGITSSERFIYEFMKFQGIRITRNVPSALKKEMAYLLIKELNEQWHLRGLNHGDVKPDNILIEVADDDELSITLCDYGFAHEAFNAKIKPVIATPFFREPEAGTQIYSYRSDNYAAAITALIFLEPNFDLDEYEKTLRFDATNKHEDLGKAFPKTYVYGDVDPDIERDEFLEELLKLLRWMTHKDPAKRPKIILDAGGNVILNEIGEALQNWEELYFKTTYSKKLKHTASISLPRTKDKRSKSLTMAIPNFASKIKRTKSEESSTASLRSAESPKSGRRSSSNNNSPRSGKISPKSEKGSPRSEYTRRTLSRRNALYPQTMHPKLNNSSPRTDGEPTTL